MCLLLAGVSASSTCEAGEHWPAMLERPRQQCVASRNTMESSRGCKKGGDGGLGRGRAALPDHVDEFLQGNAAQLMPRGSQLLQVRLTSVGNKHEHPQMRVEFQQRRRGRIREAFLRDDQDVGPCPLDVCRERLTDPHLGSLYVRAAVEHLL